MDKKKVKSVDRAFSIRKGDALIHPVFGLLIVDRIFPNGKDYNLECLLVEFNDTVRTFSALEMTRIKFRRKTRLRVVK